MNEEADALAGMEIALPIDGETAESGVSMSVGGDTGESGVSLHVGGESEETGAGKEIEADTGEHGYQTEILGDEELEEEVREPRDDYRHYGDHTFMNDVTIAGRLIVKNYVTDRDRGQWMEGETYYAGTLNAALGIYEQSHVWYEGCKYKCKVTGTQRAPLWNCQDWEFEEGNPHLTLEWIGNDDTVFIDNPEIELSLRATLYNQDLTNEEMITYDWTRESWRNGARDIASDEIWNDGHTNAGPSMLLEASDMNFQFGMPPERLIITVTATLHDSEEAKNLKLKPARAQYYMI